MDKLPDSRCPTPTGITTTRGGERRWIPCGRLLCPHCGSVVALQTVSAIVLAAPERAGFASIPDELLKTSEQRAAAPLVLRKAMRVIAREMAARGRRWEHVAVVELSADRRPHAHFLQHGDAVPPSELRAAAQEAGTGWTQMAPIRRLPVIARYVLKTPISALDLEPEAAVERLAKHKSLNGGKLASATPMFWRDARGQSVAGVQRARREAYAAWKAGRAV